MYRKQIDNTMPASIQQWGRVTVHSDGAWVYQHWTLDLIYSITRVFVLKTGKVAYVASCRPRSAAFDTNPVDGYKQHSKASDAAQACVDHFHKTLHRGSLSGKPMPTTKTKKRTTRASSTRTKARKSTTKSTKTAAKRRTSLGSTGATKSAATKRVTAISHAAQKLYHAPGNKKSWQTCIKQASKQLF